MSSPRRVHYRGEQVRYLAERALKELGRPLHHTQIFDFVSSRLDPPFRESFSPKGLNTMLHDDPKFRFRRVGRGTWTLKDP